MSVLHLDPSIVKGMASRVLAAEQKVENFFDILYIFERVTIERTRLVFVAFKSRNADNDALRISFIAFESWSL